MQLIRGLFQLQPIAKGCVLTIGNFDGVHSGHKAVIEKLAEHGRQLGLPVVVMLFEPQPLEFFLQQNAPARLMRLREKVFQFKCLPVDKLIVVRFNQQLADYDAETFILDVLVQRLQVKKLVIGDDFHFGKARRGNFAMLQTYGAEAGFSVEATSSHRVNSVRVSSSLIRDALSMGDLVTAKRYLGRGFSISGRIAHGNKRGRTLGFPTANMHLCRANSPLSGVFVVLMKGLFNRVFQGVANVGVRPTVDGDNRMILETHLFDLNQDVYGRYVEVEFLHKIRDEKRFLSLEQLQCQIESDVELAKQYFNSPVVG